jgi:NAD(P)-dependent dehydrogenase (short-subunit alcohol dehydrogenase family)
MISQATAHPAKVALVTGANRGLGLAITRQLGNLGIAVLVGVRDAAHGEAVVQQLQADGIDATLLCLDVTKQESIDHAASAIARTWGKLDILINNAGISLHEWQTAPSELTTAALKQTYETNVFGLFAVTRAMLPLLRRSAAGRIVNMSSPMGSLSLRSDPTSPYAGMPPSLAYNSSKTAVNAITVFLAAELRATAIKVNAVSPGYVATDLNGHTGFLTPEQGAALPVTFALLPPDGPSGGFFEGDAAVPW